MFYLKYRPQKFSELFGLEPIAKTLLSQVEKGKIGHAYLFYGPRGTGKTTTARLLAKAVNCERALSSRRPRGKRLTTAATRGEPCGECSVCLAIREGRFLDLIEIDAASNRGIDDVRSLREKIKLAPIRAKRKVYVVDEVHMLTTEAFNALLKTLEEPPGHAIFVLCTTEFYKVPETIKSRCQQFEFRRAASDDIVKKLKFICGKEGGRFSERDLERIAKTAQGGFRDAENLLEQLIVGGEKNFEKFFGLRGLAVPDFVSLLLEGKTREGLLFINRLFEGGADLSQFSRELLEYLRDLLLVKVGVGELVEASKGGLAEMGRHCTQLDRPKLLKIIESFEKAEAQVKRAVVPQLPLEVAVVELAAVIGGRGTERKSGAKRASKKSKREAAQPDRLLGTVVGRWEEILKGLRAYNHSLEALMRSARPVDFDGRKLRVAVFYKFHKERLAERRNLDALEKVVSSLLGKPVKVECLLGRKDV